jgi:hypothetical protein
MTGKLHLLPPVPLDIWACMQHVACKRLGSKQVLCNNLSIYRWYRHNLGAINIGVLILRLLLFGALDFRSVGADTFAVQSEPVYQQTVPLNSNYSKNCLPQLGAQRGAVKAMLENYISQEFQKHWAPQKWIFFNVYTLTKFAWITWPKWFGRFD